MTKCHPVFCSLLFFILIHGALPSEPRHWWPPHGAVKSRCDLPVCVILMSFFSNQFQVKCPYKKVNLSWFTGTVNPCPGLYQPICGTNFVTYENPCILCVESM
ncbi:serine protease inhibitor Kazal-type 14 [Felis catus]|uniref:serine protease inhibitor Kazal-type 14 n=1 Tax=Felis catus TaxID=9685 RepID=UPI001D19E831|nr:serine protease inhibitor Kazal-type 14 [Felis catus]